MRNNSLAFPVFRIAGSLAACPSAGSVTLSLHNVGPVKPGLMNGRRWWIALAMMLLTGLALPTPSGAADPDSMDELRAAYLYQFTKFVGWKSSQPDLVIGLVGDQPLRGAEHTIVGKRSQGRAVEVLNLNSGLAADQRCCDVIFGAREALSELRAARPQLFGPGVLVVSEGFMKSPPVLPADRWPTIHLYLDNDRLRFDVDLAGAQAAGLTLGSELLKNAAVVYQGANAP